MGGIKKWMGFQETEERAAIKNIDQTSVAEITDTTQRASSQTIERIRELESQLNELRSRRDITALSKEEFEILATETAMTLIKTAQQRESKANAATQKVISESQRVAKETLDGAESKARNLLNQAEIRGRRLIDAAQADAKDLIDEAENKSQEIVNQKRREAGALTSAARREAETLLLETTSEVSQFRIWLGDVLESAEKLYRVQVQSLDAASAAISQTRSKLDSSYSKLSELYNKVESTLDSDGKPKIEKKSAPAEPHSTQSNKKTSSKTVKKTKTGKKKI
jgi:cell division septum initiation protein DivIVA